MTGKIDTKWWQRAVFYQVYPRSFADGNGDGIGDFAGLISKLDYLQDLGIDAVWLSPHFPSPFVDCGYDVSNYLDVGPEYGSLEQFKQFLNHLHQRGMKLVLDLVLNHTSDRHPWFIESRSSRDNPKRDWYIWKNGTAADPTNNWYSTFGGSAWEFDALTSSYYYHYFFKEQPDLNWHNPDVKAAMFNAARFWLDMGVDGFRLDAVGTIFEDESYPSIPVDMNQEDLYKLASVNVDPQADEITQAYWKRMFGHQVDQPEVHPLMQELRAVTDEYEDRVLIGETEDIAFYGDKDNELQLNFNFPLMWTTRLSAEHVRQNQRQRLAALPEHAWPCNTLGNHDSSRVFTAYGDGKNNDLQAKLHLMLLLTLKGTPFLYNGEEIGMSDLLLNDLSKFRDPLSLLFYELEKKVNRSDEETAIFKAALMGRDRNRTPMQWSNAPNGGFCPTGIEPWLPVNPNYTQGVNVEDEAGEPNSMINFYRKMLTARKMNPLMQTGDYGEVSVGNQNVLSYFRSDLTQKILVVLNLTSEEQGIHLPVAADRILVNNLKNGILVDDLSPILKPYQGVIYSVS